MNSYIADYPRPQLVRESWENLNGRWSVAFDDEGKGMTNGWAKTLPTDREIVVPFTYQTKASGIGEEQAHPRVWYSRPILVDAKRLEKGRVMLHFEGSDFKTTLWVNGTQIGSHTGGYSRFSFDITHALQAGQNQLTVLVEDSFDIRQPRGKQRWLGENFGCWYVETTGIWKTVWLEYLPETSISMLRLTPNLTESTLLVECELHGTQTGKLTLEATATYCGEHIGQVTVPVKSPRVRAQLDVFSLNTPWGVHQWSPEDPCLYDLELRLLQDGVPVDRALSYFGMREVSIDGQNILLNGHPLYQRLILDQGYWKDSHLTPPSEAALIEDIDKILMLGYNGLRKHQKTEDERFLYWCDVKGVLVWSEMASPYGYDDTAADLFMNQWSEVVRQNYSHPSIITWTPINESWGVPQIKNNRTHQHFSEAVYHFTKSIDSTRPVIVNDGWEHTVSDILTLHDYTEKGEELLERYTLYKDDVLEGRLYHSLDRKSMADGFPYRGQPVIISEFGGIAYNNDDNGWGYGNKVTTESEFVARFDAITTAIKRLPYCCGFCYTQVTDVQQEINGIMDIERNFKADPAVIREINTRRVSCTNRG